MRDPGPGVTVVRAACPHDCPDTCAMLVTVREQDGRRVAVKIAGDPEHPTTAGVLCTKVSRYLERTYHPDRLLHPLRRIGPKGRGPLRARELGRRAGRDRRPAEGHRRARSAAHRAVQLRRHHGTGAGRSDGQPLLPQARRQLPRPHDLRDRRRRSAAATLGARLGTDVEQFQNARLIVLLGHERDRVEPAPVEPRAGGQAARREAHRDRPVPLAHGREVPRAHRADARHRRRARARRDSRAGARRLAGPRLHRRATRWASTRWPSARGASIPTVSPRCAASVPDEVASFARDYGRRGPPRFA